MDATAIEPNFLISLMSGVLDPNELYKNFGILSGIAAVGPWFYVIFIAVRFARESLDGISGQASIFKALGSIKVSLLLFLAWSSIGFAVFELMFGFSVLFEGWGSQQLIHNELLDARAKMMKQQPEEYEGFMVMILKGVAASANFMSAGFWWLIYQGMSVIYVLFNQAYGVLFAVAVGLTYIWGFVAITTLVLKGELSLMRGWAMALFALFIWAILEPILLGFLWFMLNGAEALMGMAGGGKASAVVGWYAYSTVLMVAVIAIKIFVIFASYSLAKNDSPIGALGGIAAAPTMMAINNLMNRVQQAGGGMMPDADGTRTRDRWANSMGADVRDMAGSAGRSLSDAGGKLKGGLGNLTNNIMERFSGPQDAGTVPSTPGGGGSGPAVAAGSEAGASPGGGGMGGVEDSAVAQGSGPNSPPEGNGSMGSLADYEEYLASMPNGPDDGAPNV